jgi:hypothetical protein
LTKVKFYQSKRLGFIKISSLVTLEFDSFFTYFFLTFIFLKKIETVNNKFDGFEIQTDPIPRVFTKNSAGFFNPAPPSERRFNLVTES